jgi:hemolysin activation/secretion protein
MLIDFLFNRDLLHIGFSHSIQIGTKGVQALSKSLFVRLNGSAQWTDDPLPAVEPFSVGGANFSRAFEKGLINADRGYAGLLEMAYRPLKTGSLRQSELYIFADYADVALVARAFPETVLRSRLYGGGLRLGYRKNAMLSLEAARTIDKPYPDYRSEWRFSITWRQALRP